MNENAVSGNHASPHDAAANVADGGTGGVFTLRHGAVLYRPKFAHWFSKPSRMSYEECFNNLVPLIEKSGGTLWMRHMTLGSANEFCLQSNVKLNFPKEISMYILELREVWPEKEE